MQFDRLIQLYFLLPRYPQTVTARQVQERLREAAPDFDVCLRTVQRDLELLAGCRMLSVATDDGRPARWFRNASAYALVAT
ncbi:hypothetical protein [uncultured Thiohalocapsa sp.]|uniref:hypothetical protein n=1 Tax=uncultured Thiohalocapsa sp. TaxID=768990 RepID=UPI0025D9F55B|nr:hypothetical protein [uncultured Thiohalocapsa sp.]